MTKNLLIFFGTSIYVLNSNFNVENLQKMMIIFID